MNCMYSWTVFCLTLSSAMSAQLCRWLDLHQEVMTQHILATFKQMIPAEDYRGSCHNNFSSLNINQLFQTSQVKPAATIVREVCNQIMTLYGRYQDKLPHQQQAWEKLQQLLQDQQRALADCITAGPENVSFIQEIAQEFHTIHRILQEQGEDACTRSRVHSTIHRILLMAGQLSSRMRKLHRPPSSSSS